jgi:transposase
VLPGYTGIIVRDGYKGYEHLTDALHAWCAVHYPERAVMPMGKRFSLAAAVPGLAVST